MQGSYNLQVFNTFGIYTYISFESFEKDFALFTNNNQKSDQKNGENKHVGNSDLAVIDRRQISLLVLSESEQINKLIFRLQWSENRWFNGKSGEDQGE